MTDLASRIRQARRRLALSQADLAAATGVNRSAVAQWERKGGSRPTSNNLSRIAVATEAQFEWLATGRGRMAVVENEDEAATALMLKFHAHDEIEERVLQALRKLEYWQSVVIAEMVEALGAGRNAAFGKRRA
jgi:transcriptional regulator with XRE-family HTH domain